MNPDLTPSRTTAWSPLLEGDLRQRAFEALDGLAEALAGLPIEPAGASDLARGLAGRAVALRHLAQLDRYQGLASRAEACLEGALEGLATGLHPPGLFQGLAGIAWAAHHLQETFPVPGEALGGEEMVDRCLLGHLDRRPWRQDYDLVSGLVGIGLYAWDGLPRPSAARLLTRVVEHLAELARPMPVGLAWHTAPELLPDWQRDRDPDGYFNLGVAHGVPAVINLLARAGASGIARDLCLHLAREGGRWLGSTRRPEGDVCCFGSVLGLGGADAPRSGRLAWCYGDLGVAVALLGAARHLGDPGLEREALTVGLAAAARTTPESRAQDAGLCHGAAGNGHLFNRLYQATGQEAFRSAALHWMGAALDLRTPGLGLGGYRAWLKPEHPQGPWQDEPGLLEGSAGIALALLAALEPLPPVWDRMLLLDLPDRLPA